MPLDVDALAIRELRWWRHTLPGADPGARSLPPPDGRWQRGAIVEALYLAGDGVTLWAEAQQHLAEAGIPRSERTRRELWTWAAEPGLEVADLTSAERLTCVGLLVPRPGRKTWPPYQAVGETLWREGWRGLLAPSAAQPPDGVVLCVFRSGADALLPVRPWSRSEIVD